MVHRCSCDLNFSLLVMLNIILYAYEPSLCFLWKYVYLGLLLSFFFLHSLFFVVVVVIELYELFVYFGD